ncbi:MAG: hypothetical protein LBP36_02760 [Oscillospiraceae bacterium]|nr:hypothetical protein [Oscillospiraceae bacterium]
MLNEVAALSYKGKPLVRSGDRVFLGDIAKDDYVIEIDLSDFCQSGGIKVSKKAKVSLLRSSSVIHRKNGVAVKSSERDGFYEAIDVGSVWLERALATR